MKKLVMFLFVLLLSSSISAFTREKVICGEVESESNQFYYVQNEMFEQSYIAPAFLKLFEDRFSRYNTICVTYIFKNGRNIVTDVRKKYY